MNKRQVQHAVDTGLSRVEFTARHKNEVISAIQGEKVMKRKIPAALVLALVLVVLAACALAAVLLSGREFVGDVMAPAAMESADAMWSLEEVDAILRIAGEHGLALDADTVARLSQQDGVYKEELMRLFVKLDLGFYPSTWPLEDQVWYEQMQVETGLKTPDDVARFLPGEGDLTQEEAIAIAQRTIHAQFDAQADLENEAIYLRHMTYQNLQALDGAAGRGWYVQYQALDLAHDGYIVHIWPDGTVFDPVVFPGIGSAQAPAEPMVVSNRYIDLFGMWYDWEMDTWIAYATDLQRSLSAHPNARTGSLERAVSQQAYGIPDAGALDKAAAIDLAVAAIAEDDTASKGALLPTSAYGVYLLGEEVPVWKISVPQQGAGNWQLEMDAYTGEVRNIRLWEPGTPISQAFVLQSVYDSLPEPSTQAVG